MGNFQEKIAFIWDLADLLRGVYKRNEYQKVIELREKSKGNTARI